MPVKHLQLLAAFQRHAIRLPPLRLAIRLPQILQRLQLHYLQKPQPLLLIAIPVAFPPRALPRLAATRQLPLPAVAIPVAFPTVPDAADSDAADPDAATPDAVNPDAATPDAALAPLAAAITAAEPALPAVKTAATEVAEDFSEDNADVADARIPS